MFLLTENQYFVIVAFKTLNGIQIRVYKITNESVIHFRLYILVKVKKNLGKSQPQFREKVRKLRLGQNDGFLIKKSVLEF